MSLAAAEPLWSDLQLSWLQAMGHAVYLDRDLPEPERAEVAPAALTNSQPNVRRQAPPMPETRASEHAPIRQPAAPRAKAPTVPVTQLERAAPASGRRRIGMPDRLQLAMLRVIGRSPDDPDVRAAMQSWDLDQLRADPAAKRAIWPQLRALRKQRNS